MLPFRPLFCVALLSTATAAMAQETPGSIAPLPPVMDRITPEQNSDAAILTTRDAPPADSPFQKQGAPEVPPQVNIAPPGTQATPPAPPSFSTFQGKIPFGRAEYSGPAVPSGPHKTEAVPVVGVEAVEASEAAPPTPIAPEADPAQEDPAAPTDLTSPIFEPEAGPATQMPRKIVMRALNKVTAQSELFTLKPGENVKFGQISITAQACRTSSPTSQTDYAGFLDIVEELPKPTGGTKPLFRGWMYASSPSITSLEHPVYDVTMVECKMIAPKPEKAEKEDKKSAKKR